MEMVGIQKGRMLEERRVLEEGGRRGGGDAISLHFRGMASE